jgi:hypothetical protein
MRWPTRFGWTRPSGLTSSPSPRESGAMASPSGGPHRPPSGQRAVDDEVELSASKGRREHLEGDVVGADAEVLEHARCRTGRRPR